MKGRTLPSSQKILFNNAGYKFYKSSMRNQGNVNSNDILYHEIGRKMESLITLSFVRDVGVSPRPHTGARHEGRASAQFPRSIGQCEGQMLGVGWFQCGTRHECTHVCRRDLPGERRPG